MTENSPSHEISLLRQSLDDFQRTAVTIDRFTRHEDLDEQRHKESGARLVAMETAQANLNGRLAVIAFVLVTGIPILSWFVNVVLGPHIVAKP